MNPNFLLPGALQTRASDIAAHFVKRMTAGVGQMCLKPGMIIAIDGVGFEQLRDALAAVRAETMLSPGISSGRFPRSRHIIVTSPAQLVVHGYRSPVHHRTSTSAARIRNQLAESAVSGRGVHRVKLHD
ncbi:hypothetical protein G2912_21590 [Paraburkholderia aspalathi]|nr:hypothetical protein [Paraburkholderia aspalathi]